MYKNTKKLTLQRRKSKLARYLHTGGYRRLADRVDTVKRKNNFWRAQKIYIILGVIFFVIGIAYILF